MRRAVRMLLAAVVIGSVLFLFVLPGRTWLQQSQAMSNAEKRETLLAKENQALSRQLAQLNDPNYLEQVARAQYGLVLPNEKAYNVLPPVASTTPSTTTTTIAPQ